MLAASVCVVGVASAEQKVDAEFQAQFKSAYEKQKKTAEPVRFGEFSVGPDGSFQLDFKDSSGPKSMRDALEQGVLKGTEKAVIGLVEKQGGSLITTTFGGIFSTFKQFVHRQQYYATFPDIDVAFLSDADVSFMHDSVDNNITTLLYMATTGISRDKLSRVGINEYPQWEFLVDWITRDFLHVIARLEEVLVAYQEVLDNDMVSTPGQRTAGIIFGTLSRRQISDMAHCAEGIIDTLQHLIETLEAIENWQEVDKDQKEYIKSDQRILNTLFAHLAAYVTGSNDPTISKTGQVTDSALFGMRNE